MSLKLLTDYNLEFLSLNEGCTGSSESTLFFQNVTLLEISCTGSYAVKNAHSESEKGKWQFPLLVEKMSV